MQAAASAVGATLASAASWQVVGSSGTALKQQPTRQPLCFQAPHTQDVMHLDRHLLGWPAAACCRPPPALTPAPPLGPALSCLLVAAAAAGHMGSHLLAEGGAGARGVRDAPDSKAQGHLCTVTAADAQYATCTALAADAGNLSMEHTLPCTPTTFAFLTTHHPPLFTHRPLSPPSTPHPAPTCEMPLSMFVFWVRSAPRASMRWLAPASSASRSASCRSLPCMPTHSSRRVPSPGTVANELQQAASEGRQHHTCKGGRPGIEQLEGLSASRRRSHREPRWQTRAGGFPALPPTARPASHSR